MAYDPNDPKDKAILDKAVKDALEEQAAEHEADIVGLKDKNKELLGKLKKAEKGEGDPAEVARLEGELEVVQGQLKDAKKALDKTTKDLTTANTALEGERTFASQQLLDAGLSAELGKANIKPEFLPAAMALLKGKATVKIEGENRSVVVGDKSLGDYVKEWSQGDEGKHYVAAGEHGGSGAPGGKANAGGKTITRAAYDAMQPAEASGFFAGGGTLTD